MCFQAVEDVLCSEPGCNTVIACKQIAPGSRERCEIVKKAAQTAPQPPKHAHPITYDIPRSQPPVYAQPRDWCRDIRTFQRPARKSRGTMCRACQFKPVAEQNELYAELGEALAESREMERERDAWRRLRRVAGSPAGNLGITTVTPPTDQASLVSGADMGWQGGSAAGAAGTGGYPEVGAVAYPLGLDFGLGEPGQGWDHYDGGFGPTPGYHQGQGHNQDPGRGR